MIYYLGLSFKKTQDLPELLDGGDCRHALLHLAVSDPLLIDLSFSLELSQAALNCLI